ncbi:hypothetical protein EV13_2249 [Prochlorococcus sp. MIT 0702]|nr:hypothetical protein EV13_2249 [Prochlorococcus sp. MIT 0702]
MTPSPSIKVLFDFKKNICPGIVVMPIVIIYLYPMWLRNRIDRHKHSDQL